MIYSRFSLFFLALVITFSVSCKDDDEDTLRDVVIHFQDIAFPSGENYVNKAEEGTFILDIVSFPNIYDEKYFSWSGFAFSQMHDMENKDWENQYSVYASNDPENNKFAVAYVSMPDETDPGIYVNKLSITFSQTVQQLSFDVANTTVAALLIRDGSDFSKKFEEGDWFKLSYQAYDIKGQSLPETAGELFLAENTSVLDKWVTINIPGNSAITRLEFSLSSSDNSPFGMNTPAFFCLDNIKAKTSN